MKILRPISTLLIVAALTLVGVSVGCEEQPPTPQAPNTTDGVQQPPEQPTELPDRRTPEEDDQTQPSPEDSPTRY